MKVKVLSANIMVDYKKINLGQVIDLPDNTAKQFIKDALVELVDKSNDESNEKKVDPIIIIVNGEEVNLANMSGKELAEFAKQHELTPQQSKETVPNFAKRLKQEFEAKASGNKE